jgi:hypothetical protein
MRLPECCRRLDTKSGGNRDHLGQSIAHCKVSMRNAAVLNEWLVPIADPLAGRLGCAAGSTQVATRQQRREQMSMTSSETRRTSVEQASADARRSLPTSTNWARHQRGSPSLRRIADMVGLQFAHDPKEIDVEPRILGTRLRITRAYRSYGARVGIR